MGLTILEALQDKFPNGAMKRNVTLKCVYDLIKKHQAEIEEARDRGYSWKQIDVACREAWEKNGTLPKNITWWRTATMVESCYRAVKNGTTAGEAYPAKKLTKKEKPLSLKVTVEKR